MGPRETGLSVTDPSVLAPSVLAASVLAPSVTAPSVARDRPEQIHPFGALVSTFLLATAPSVALGCPELIHPFGALRWLMFRYSCRALVLGMKRVRITVPKNPERANYLRAVPCEAWGCWTVVHERGTNMSFRYPRTEFVMA